MLIRIFVFASLYLFCVLVGFGQSTQLPYYCGFEDSNENQKWVLNYNPNLPPGRLTNLWHLGGAVSASGQKSLYVSADGGKTASYTNSANTILAYRVFDLPAGVYDLAFDWMAYGDATSAIHVAWVDSTLKRVMSLTSPDLPLVIKQHELKMSDRRVLNGTAVWKRATTQFVVEAGKKYKLVFAWNNVDAPGINPGGCIDNIEIAKSVCGKPSDLKVTKTANNLSATWQGNANAYQFAYKKIEDNDWICTMVNGKNSYSISALSNGVYDLRVRSVCGSDTSLWMYFDKQLVYSALCVDYLDLSSAECYSGTVEQLKKGEGVLGKIDYGFDDVRSRHTVHFLPGEKDPRTKNLLKTVPDGEVASVRVGTWDNAHAESVTYNYKVDSTIARVMMLKYAIVFEDPNHPNINEQPHFLLQIFDENGVQLSPDCAQADFYAKSGIDGWTSLEYGGRNLVWKDWTTLGINLGPLHGHNIKIKITVYGCAFIEHYAYAYFTLSCSSGKLEGINCGDTPTTEFIAPEGFHYRWYEKGKSNIVLSDSCIFDVAPNDTRDYCVDVMYPENHNCYFTLQANATPRFPKAKADFNVEYKDCKSYVSCKSKSYVETKFGISKDNVESLQWYCDNVFISGADSIIYELPNDGKLHNFKLIAGLCDNMCTDTFVFDCSSHLLEPQTFEQTEVLCVPIDSLNNVKPDRVDSLKSVFGCDSIVVTHFRLVSSTDTIINAEICSDSVFMFNGTRIVESGTYYDTLQSVLGCDSIIELHVVINEAIEARVKDKFVLCADDLEFSIPIELLSGNIDTISVEFLNVAKDSIVVLSSVYADGYINVKLAKELTPNIYNVSIILTDKLCGDYIVSLRVEVHYSSSIVRQKWNDVFAVLNSTYNGGYDFVSFQWCKNGVPIAGETKSYYYTGGVNFNQTDSFSVVLTRADGITLPTCNIGATQHSELSDYNVISTSARVGQKFYINNIEPCEVYVYNSTGLFVESFVVDSYSELLLSWPEGLYVLVCKSQTSTSVIKLLLID